MPKKQEESWEEVSGRHGGAYDRGSADYYYHRPRQPHYFMGGTYNSPRVDEQNMTEDEIDDYNQGYDDAERDGDQKDYR